MPIRVFEYGLKSPTLNGALVESQMRAAHIYRNKLTEMELARRKAIREIMAAHPDMAPLEAKLAELVTQRDEVRKAITTARGITRSRSENPEQRSAARELGKQIRELKDQIKANRKAVAQAVKPQLDAIEVAHVVQVKAARKANGVYWGTYLLQEADADRARQEIFPPKFRSWRGEGRVSVQLQKGITLEELFGEDTQLHIDPVSERAHDPGTRRGDRRRARSTWLKMRVQSDASQRPVWAVWPMKYHRPIPAGGIIKVATVSRRRHDCRSWDWILHITVEIPDSAVPPAPSSGVIALNLGFCQRPGGALRAGFMVGSDGSEHEILAPASVVDALGACDSIRSIRDKNMDQMKASMSQWLATIREAHERALADVAKIAASEPLDSAWSRLVLYIQAGAPVMPAWFAAAAQTLHAWRSADRFRRLAFQWRQNRWPGDEIGYNLLEGGPDGVNDWRTQKTSWRYRDEHLERYESGMRRRALLRRRETYRTIAARVAARYHTLLIDDTDLRDFQRSPTPESEAVDITPVKRNRGLVAGSELRLTMVNAFGKERVIKSKPTTMPCHACGTVNQWDRLEDNARIHRCSNCGDLWDQDANACKNMLAQYTRDLAIDQAEPANDGPKRLTRSERLRKNRDARAAARKADAA
jgi:hypothetical protein